MPGHLVHLTHIDQQLEPDNNHESYLFSLPNQGMATRGAIDRMSYYLLTGVTGLLGRYVLRDLFARGARLGVLVRASKLNTAAQRIEAVMRHWEAVAGHSLPRPVVFQGDLSRPGLALDDRARKWVGDHCDAVVHSAAAMTFRPDDRGEPWRTNVEGVGNLLKLCQETGIRKFHHISTAYICGLRTGRILEEEVDLGQPLGNVYEQSKLKAETMVRSAPFLDELTVYRPSSIVGDSRTGFTTSYHGFYLPLQLAYAMASRIPPAQMDERFVSLLGLTGREGKNLVPVDWLSAAIAALVTRPECHGVTYHLASPSPVPVRLVQEVVQEAVGKYSGRPPAKRVDQAELAAYERLFQDHMEVYKSHWRDDPEFDLTNSSGVLDHIPCPAMDRDLLMRVARFAVESKFSLRRHESAETPFDVARHLQPLVDAARQLDGAPGTAESIALQVNGRGGGQWHLWTSAGRLVGAELGLGARSTARFYLGAAAFAALARGGATVEAAIGAGQVVVEGDRKAQPGLIRILKQVVSAR